jgi:hypothetical protein
VVVSSYIDIPHCIFRVPETTLEIYVRLESNYASRTETKLGRNPLLACSLKEHLLQHCLNMEKCVLGLAICDVRHLAYQWHREITYKTCLLKPLRRLEKERLKPFLQQHPQLTVTTPQGLSHAQATGFTPEAVSQFFSFFEPAMEKKSTILPLYYLTTMRQESLLISTGIQRFLALQKSAKYLLCKLYSN